MAARALGLLQHSHMAVQEGGFGQEHQIALFEVTMMNGVMAHLEQLGCGELACALGAGAAIRQAWAPLLVRSLLAATLCFVLPCGTIWCMCCVLCGAVTAEARGVPMRPPFTLP